MGSETFISHLVRIFVETESDEDTIMLEEIASRIVGIHVDSAMGATVSIEFETDDLEECKKVAEYLVDSLDSTGLVFYN